MEIPKLPNIRKLFLPDPGKLIFDTDLASADLRIVVWESDCKPMKAMLAAGLDPYTEVAKEFYQDDSIDKKDHRRQLFKSFCHGSNYLGTAPGLAHRLGLTVARAQETQSWYFKRFPEIKNWHTSLTAQVQTKQEVRNIFGYRWKIMDRIEGTIMNRACAWIPQCVPIDHEVLTLSGWKPISATSSTDAIAVWNSDGSIFFETPSAWHHGFADKLVHLPELGYSCTTNHRIPYYNAGRDTLQCAEASVLPQEARIPRTGFYSGDMEFSSAEIAFLVAFQADGHWDKRRGSISFEFQKSRKIHRMRVLLTELGITFSENIIRRGSTVFYISKTNHYFNESFKTFGPWLLKLSAENLDCFLSELEFWDGWRSPGGELWFSSKEKNNCNWVTTIAALRGKRARWLSTDTRGKNPVYRITIAPNKGQCSITSREIVSGARAVACPTVSTGYFMLRYNGEISVTGNSTVACLINRIWMRIENDLPEVEILMQVHDSLVGTLPRHLAEWGIKRIMEVSQVPLPYPGDPLIIPLGIKSSEKSWGDCQ